MATRKGVITRLFFIFGTVYAFCVFYYYINIDIYFLTT